MNDGRVCGKRGGIMRRSVHAAASRMLCGLLAVLISAGYPYMPFPRAVAQPTEQSPGSFYQWTFPPAWAQQANSGIAQKLIEEGIAAYQKGQYEEAVRKLSQARSLAPAHSSIALYLGLAYLRQGKTAEAIAAWQEYTRL